MKHYFCLWVSAVSLALASCSADNSTTTHKPTVHNVFLVSPVAAGTATSRQYPGIVQETRTISTAFKTPGQLTSLLVKEGDHVREGQLLATLDTVDYALAVRQLQIQYDQALAEHNRRKQLYAAGNMSDNEFEKADAGLRQMAVQLDLNKNKLAYTKLYAPSSGVIIRSNFEKAEMVDAGTPIFELMDDSRLEVLVDIPLSQYVNHSRSNTYTGYSPLLGDTPVELQFISLTPKADNNQLYQLKLAVASRDPRLTSGMNLVVDLSSDGAAANDSIVNTAVEIPLRAVFDHGGTTSVWTFNPADSTVRATPVTIIGDGSHGTVTALSGISPASLIVSGGVHALTDGEHVKVIPQTSSSNRGALL